jgi:hypothetical protein
MKEEAVRENPTAIAAVIEKGSVRVKNGRAIGKGEAKEKERQHLCGVGI